MSVARLFTPSLGEASADDPATPVAEVREKFLACRSAAAPRERQMAENLAFFLGRHYAAYDPVTHRVSDAAPRWRVRMTDNRILATVMQLLAKIESAAPEVYVLPASSDDDDVRKARVAEALLRWQDATQNASRRRRDIHLWTTLFGLAYEKVFFEPSAACVCRAPDGGIQRQAVGDIRTESLGPHEVYADPSAVSFERAPWVIQHAVLSGSEVYRRYGVEISESEVLLDRLHWLSVPGEIGGLVRRGVEILEYWERPTMACPRGRYCVIGGDELLYRGDLPYLAATGGEVEIPFVQYCAIRIPQQAHGMSLVEHLIPHQKALNKIHSLQMENYEMLAHPKFLAPATMPRTFKLTREPGQVVPWSGQGAAPQWLSPPGLPPNLLQHAQMLQAGFDAIAGQTDLRRGNGPSGVTSATGLALLREEDESRVGDLVREFASGLRDEASIRLKLTRAFYTQRRVLSIAGRNRRAETIEFLGSELTSTDVQVGSGAALSQSRVLRTEQILSLVRAGVKDAAWAGRQLDGMETVAGAEPTPSERRALEENRWLELGRRLRIARFDDHAAHIRLHAEEMNRRWDEWSPAQRAEAHWHVRAHAAAIAGADSAELFEWTTGDERVEWRTAAVSQSLRAAPPPTEPEQTDVAE